MWDFEAINVIGVVVKSVGGQTHTLLRKLLGLATSSYPRPLFRSRVGHYMESVDQLICPCRMQKMAGCGINILYIST